MNGHWILLLIGLVLSMVSGMNNSFQIYNKKSGGIATLFIYQPTSIENKRRFYEEENPIDIDIVDSLIDIMQ